MASELFERKKCELFVQSWLGIANHIAGVLVRRLGGNRSTKWTNWFIDTPPIDDDNELR